jgi:hypothetical protein
MKKLILSTFVSLFVIIHLSSQLYGNPLQNKPVIYEKLYLHIDREVYSPGDNIWFKSYLTNGDHHKLISDYRNIYVQLISEHGEIIDSCMMLSLNGVAANDFLLSDSIPEGSYTLRAYTKYLLNFGEESLFHKKIAVRKVNSNESMDKSDETNKIDISFLPEGGNLVLNSVNHIAFKAINDIGKGINITGKIFDEAGMELITFETSYKGMGQFILTPGEGKTYFAKIDNFPEFSYQFPKAIENGISLHYSPSETDVQLILNRNFKSTGTQNLILKASHKGEELFNEEISFSGFQHPVEIYKGFFPIGISKITVSDLSDNVLAERLIFIRNTTEKSMNFNLNKEEFDTRKLVKLNVNSLINLDNDTLNSSFSLAVVNEDYFNEGGVSQSMESYILLDSELKGSLESPANYFVDEEGISVDEKLNLAMMVNGWRRYLWDNLENFDDSKMTHSEDAGVSLNGKVTTLFGNKPVEGSIVELGPFSNMFLILRDTTDRAGRYSFDRLYLLDSSKVMINVIGKKNVEIYNETPPVFDTKIISKTLNNLAFKIDVPNHFFRANYYRYLRERDFELEHGSILIKDVDVKGDKNFMETVFIAIWGYPNRTFDLIKEDILYTDFGEFIEFKFPGIMQVERDFITYRGAPVACFLDGLSSSFRSINDMPIGDISKMYFYKNSIAMAMLGSKSNGASALLSVFTKIGLEGFDEDFERIIHGRIVPTVTGFKQNTEFYAPDYALTEPNEIEYEKPDFRPTLYWNPFVRFNDDAANIEFYTSDMLGKYLVIIEGINRNGTVFHEKINFDVVVSN